MMTKSKKDSCIIISQMIKSLIELQEESNEIEKSPVPHAMHWMSRRNLKLPHDYSSNCIL